jgi:hypothetical protein
MKTSELQGAALDWAVHTAQGLSEEEFVEVDNLYGPQWRGPEYSTSWQEGGPLIEREGVTTAPRKEHGKRVAWVATLIEPPAVCECEGKTQLIAAMRCYVQSRLGDEVDVPEELQ